ncbi:MAG: OadG family protein [Desulfarculus sp.]|nr:OadG family protein [Desulfarculus sp.]
MNNWDFGLTLTLVGMGGTLVSLWVLTFVMKAMKRLFPVKLDKSAGTGSGEGK